MKKLLCVLFCTIAGFAHDETFPRPPQREISVEAQPWVKNCIAEPYLVADFIYWKVRQDGLDYVLEGVGAVGNPVTSKGKVFEPDFKGEPGFRIGLGLNLAHDGWDLLLNYTWIHPSSPLCCSKLGASHWPPKHRPYQYPSLRHDLL